MRKQGKPGLWLGLWSGLFLTLPLVAIFYLGYRLAALPFPPFNLFDWQTRTLPGWVLAKGINTMVRVIEWTHATDTSSLVFHHRRPPISMTVHSNGLVSGVADC